MKFDIKNNQYGGFAFFITLCGILGLFIVLSTNAYSQGYTVLKPGSRNITGMKAGERGAPFDIVLYGKKFTLTPVMMSHATLDWEGAKNYLPDDISEAPAQPLSDEQILEKIKKMDEILRFRYDEQVKIYALSIIEKQPSENEAYVEREIAGDLHSGFYHEKNPKLQFIHDQSLAVNYLYVMLSEAMGLGPVRW